MMNRSLGIGCWVYLFATILSPAMADESTSAGDGPAAVVNGQVISNRDLDSAFHRTSVSKQPMTPEQRQMYRAHVLNVLIDNVLLKQYLEHEGVKADPKLVSEHLAEFEQNLEDGGKTLDEFLALNHVSEEQMQREIVDLHQWLAYVRKQSTDQRIRQYFFQNRAAFDGSQVRASHILIEFPPMASPEVKAAARRRIQQIQVQLSGGTDFASLAQQHSDCQSKSQGGDVGYFPRKGKMTEPFAAAAFATPKGQVTDIVESEYGYHLIKVTDRREGQGVALETVIDEVRSLFAGDLRSDIIVAMRKNAEIKIPAVAVAQQPSATLTR